MTYEVTSRDYYFDWQVFHVYKKALAPFSVKYTTDDNNFSGYGTITIELNSANELVKVADALGMDIVIRRKYNKIEICDEEEPYHADSVTKVEDIGDISEFMSFIKRNIVLRHKTKHIAIYGDQTAEQVKKWKKDIKSFIERSAPCES